MLKNHEENIYPYSDIGNEPIYGTSKKFRQKQRVSVELLTSKDIEEILKSKTEFENEEKKERN